ncbi:MAG: KpsF/GutQ family sugar-phosphate isomerase [Proteobacteria bacterium]|nr:KpsF/GutQ family sugar-phosphate isomerase [Pseudomonadota bacterium]
MSIEQAIEVLKIEAEGILRLADRIDDNFTRMVDIIYQSKGCVIISGIGKSGIVGRKIVATLNSTGTNSIFLHPVEAMHGDLGIVRKDDVFLALSNSGETEELNILLSSIRKKGCPVIALTGKKDSTLARLSDVVIDVGVDKEACPLGLAPTSSTTALLAMGDALAVVLIKKKDFKSKDFRKNHPGGNLGQRLAGKVSHIMLTGDIVPSIIEGASLTDTIKVVDRYKLGVALIIKPDQTLTGIITDGDIRHFIAEGKSIDTCQNMDVMTKNPRTIKSDSPVYDALNLMEKHQITVLPVVDPHGRILGVLHLHDILGKGTLKFNGS